MSDERIVIVGGGLAAARVVEGLPRGEAATGRVTMVSADTARPTTGRRYRRGSCAARSRQEQVFVEPESFYAENGVEVRLGPGYGGVDSDAREVKLSDGERIPYGRLVLAAGSTPRRLGVAGEDSDGVHIYRTLDGRDGGTREAAGRTGARRRRRQLHRHARRRHR